MPARLVVRADGGGNASGAFHFTRGPEGLLRLAAGSLQAVAAAQPPTDLVLLEVVMPDGGLEPFRRIKAERPDVRVLEGEAQRILDAGADGFLPKPFELDELRRVAEAALAAR